MLVTAVHCDLHLMQKQHEIKAAVRKVQREEAERHQAELERQRHELQREVGQCSLLYFVVAAYCGVFTAVVSCPSVACMPLFTLTTAVRAWCHSN